MTSDNSRNKTFPAVSRPDPKPSLDMIAEQSNDIALRNTDGITSSALVVAPYDQESLPGALGPGVGSSSKIQPVNTAFSAGRNSVAMAASDPGGAFTDSTLGPGVSELLGVSHVPDGPGEHVSGVFPAGATCGLRQDAQRKARCVPHVAFLAVRCLDVQPGLVLEDRIDHGA